MQNKYEQGLILVRRFLSPSSFQTEEGREGAFDLIPAEALTERFSSYKLQDS